ncbi:MAG: hypothetical protein AB8F74_22450 [Saprospiraceae bacterium]
MNKIKFTYRPFYLALATTLFLVLFYQAIVATINGNPFGYIPAVVALALIFLMAMRHEYTRMILKIWASVFMILVYAIKIISKYVTQSGNLDSGFIPSSIYLNVTFVIIGILAIIGGQKFIAPVEETDKDI